MRTTLCICLLLLAACTPEVEGNKPCDRDQNGECVEPPDGFQPDPEPEGFQPDPEPGNDPEPDADPSPGVDPEPGTDPEPDPIDPDSQPPNIDSIQADAAVLGPDGVLTITAEVSDPQGAHTLFGGTLIDANTDTAIGEFALAEPGLWTAALDWAAFNAAEPIGFGSGGSDDRTIDVVFSDLSGNEADETLQVSLRCDNDLDAAVNGVCAAPQGPEIVNFTATRTEIVPGQNINFRVIARTDPDFPPGPLTASLGFNSRDQFGQMQAESATTFTMSLTWEQMNRVAPLEYDDVDRGARRSVRVTVEDERGQRTTESIAITARCTNPNHINVEGQCVGECFGGINRCGRFGSYGSNCYTGQDFCWWLEEESNNPRSTSCDDLCGGIGLRCDPEVGFPSDYTNVRDDCHGSPGCYSFDDAFRCNTPLRSEENGLLKCLCVR